MEKLRKEKVCALAEPAPPHTHTPPTPTLSPKLSRHRGITQVLRGKERERSQSHNIRTHHRSRPLWHTPPTWTRSNAWRSTAERASPSSCSTWSVAFAVSPRASRKRSTEQREALSGPSAMVASLVDAFGTNSASYTYKQGSDMVPGGCVGWNSHAASAIHTLAMRASPRRRRWVESRAQLGSVTSLEWVVTIDLGQ